MSENVKTIEEARTEGTPCSQQQCCWFNDKAEQNCDAECAGEPAVASCEKYLPEGISKDVTCPCCHSKRLDERGKEKKVYACNQCHCVWLENCRTPNPLAEAMAGKIAEMRKYYQQMADEKPWTWEEFVNTVVDVLNVERAYRERGGK